MRGLEFFVLSLVDVTQRKAYPLAVQQTVRSEAEKAAIKERKKTRTKAPKKPKGKPKGRPKGSRNKDKNEVKLSCELLRINALLAALLQLLRVFVRVKYLALDGHFGHQQAVLMARQNGLQLISKLRDDAALSEPYEGAYSGRGPQRKYRSTYFRVPHVRVTDRLLSKAGTNDQNAIADPIPTPGKNRSLLAKKEFLLLHPLFSQ